jgi:hypothetical protein
MCSSLCSISASHIVQELVQRWSGGQVACSHFGNGRRTRSMSSFLLASCMFLPVVPQFNCNTSFSRLCQTILVLIFGRSELYISILGFIALGLESTLPIPQLIRYAQFCRAAVSLRRVCSNYRQRSLYGFRMSTLIGWAGGDTFKHAIFANHVVPFSTDTAMSSRTVYFFLQHSPIQFKVCAIFQLSIDFGKLAVLHAFKILSP